MQARITDSLAELRARHPGGVLVAVPRRSIKAAVNHAMGAHLDLFQRIVISPARSRPSPTAAPTRRPDRELHRPLAGRAAAL